MDSKKPKKEINGVAKLRERFYEIKRNIKLPTELAETLKQRDPLQKKNDEAIDEKKIASPKPREDLDL